MQIKKSKKQNFNFKSIPNPKKKPFEKKMK